MLQSLGFPVVCLAPIEAKRRLWIDIRLRDGDGYLGDTLTRPIIAKAADKRWQDALERGKTVFNHPNHDEPNLLRLRAFEEKGSRLILDVEPTWFWTLLGTNMQLRAGRWPGVDLMTAAEREDISNLAESRLANCLAVNLVILSADDPPMVLIQQRGEGSAVAFTPYQISAAGFVDRTDLAADPADVVTNAAIREAYEETGLTITAESISWLALGRDTWSYGIGIACYCTIDANARGLSPKPTKDQFEVKGFEWWEFTPTSIMERWSSLGYWYSMVPQGAFALLTTLAHRYGEHDVLAAWRASGSIGAFPKQAHQ